MAGRSSPFSRTNILTLRQLGANCQLYSFIVTSPFVALRANGRPTAYHSRLTPLARMLPPWRGARVMPYRPDTTRPSCPPTPKRLFAAIVAVKFLATDKHRRIDYTATP